jgi:hypothetical protein
MKMTRRDAFLSLGLGALMALLAVPVQQVFAAKSKEATVTLEIHGMV